jgi:hypothetical protein
VIVPLAPAFAKEFERRRAQPAMPRVTVEAFVPVLGDLDAGQLQRGLERDQAKRRRNACSEIFGQRGDAVGLRGDDGAGEEARHA